MSWALVGGMALGAAASYYGGQQQNQANRDMAHQSNIMARENSLAQIDFQREMSNSAYQRSTQDMYKAGLNPALAGLNQSPASTPAGASAQVSTPHMEDALSKTIGSALEFRRLKKELDATDSQIGLNAAAAKTQEAQTALNLTSAKRAAKEIEALDAQMPALKQESKVRQKRGEWDEKAVDYDAIVNRVGKATGIVNDAAGVFKPKININRGGNTKTIYIDKKTGEIMP